MTSANTAQPAPTPRIDSQAGNSPTSAAVPFWVTACIRLTPPRRPNGAAMETTADKVLTAAQALIADRCKAHGDAEVELDRDLVATICGYSSAKKCGWLFDYLESIGFLVIERRYAAPGSDGSRRGRQTDTFVTFDEPPLNYVGPHNYAELARALRDPNRPLASILFVDEGSQNPSSDRKSPDGNLRRGPRYPYGNLDHVSAGQTESPQMGTFGADQGTHMGTLIEETAGQTEGAQMGTFPRARFDQIESSPRIRRGEDSIEPVPGGTAQPPATGQDEQQRAAVVELVARLPWREWAKRAKREFAPTLEDAEQVQVAILDAMAAAGVSLEQATKIACAALRKATGNPVSYVASAFSARNVGRWVRVIEAAPLSDDPLPLDGPAGDASPPDEPPNQVSTSADDEHPEPYRPACEQCDAKEGDGPGKRYRLGEDGRRRACECRPASLVRKPQR